MPNKDQIISSLRWFVTTFGGAVAGWFAAKGWFTIDQVTSILNSPALLGGAASLIIWVWSLFAHTDAAKINAAATVASVDPQQLTPEGLKLAVASPVIAVKAS